MCKIIRCLMLAAAALWPFALTSRVDAGIQVYATSSTGNGASEFGTLDLTTGQFTEIAQLAQAIGALTADSGGSLYAGTEGSGRLYTITASGVATQFGSVTVPVDGFWGLADAGSSGFYAVNFNSSLQTGYLKLDQIASDGNSLSTISTLPDASLIGSGTLSLSFGPGGGLYDDERNTAGIATLYSINPTTGAATAIGAGLGSLNNDPLTLVNAGGQLYGIDTIEAAGSGPINIYTINTSTGLATATGVTVSGLQSGYTLDTAAGSVPQPVPEPSMFILMATGVVGLGLVRQFRKIARKVNAL